MNELVTFLVAPSAWAYAEHTRLPDSRGRGIVAGVTTNFALFVLDPPRIWMEDPAEGLRRPSMVPAKEGFHFYHLAGRLNRREESTIRDDGAVGGKRVVQTLLIDVGLPVSVTISRGALGPHLPPVGSWIEVDAYVNGILASIEQEGLETCRGVIARAEELRGAGSADGDGAYHLLTVRLTPTTTDKDRDR